MDFKEYMSYVPFRDLVWAISKGVIFDSPVIEEKVRWGKEEAWKEMERRGFEAYAYSATFKEGVLVGKETLEGGDRQLTFSDGAVRRLPRMPFESYDLDKLIEYLDRYHVSDYVEISTVWKRYEHAMTVQDARRRLIDDDKNNRHH